MLREIVGWGKEYEQQNSGTGGIGGGLSCGGGGRDNVKWRYGCGGGENAAGIGTRAASYRAEGHKPEGYGPRHCIAAARYKGHENAGDGREYVAYRYGSAKILADLQTLRGRPS